MPELPEVETIRIGLEPRLIGQTITSVEILHSKTLTLEQVSSSIIGHKITGLGRQAKILIIELSNHLSLLVHLKMTGQMVLVEASGQRLAGGHPTKSMAAELPDGSTRIIFGFASGDCLFFNDQRKFGWIQIVPTAEISSHNFISRLGPEPLGTDFTLPSFKAALKRHPKSPIKAVILDQSTVAGIGNIYADEALHLAKIHPATKAGNLTPAQIKRLFEAIKTIIASGIEHGGTSFAHYVNALGGKGDYLDHARVFRRTGQPCPVCATTIIKIRVAGRGTHVCPKCQKAPKV
ncbi:MAG TPA: bifunctional DNA-formamidopyrimidine glycosylase/DNA-(apurinic or apyrimidinic site) lyase [Candidatus Saccharimonadales bacterium]|nr:bifunctional DNA-formamidopyrimidine glycosylase/DNA-(apurinic or apyrimidinic site) lyase [Candidatus Saccharimonadales bacterium]